MYVAAAQWFVVRRFSFPKGGFGAGTQV